MELRDFLERYTYKDPVIATMVCERTGQTISFELRNAWDEFVFMITQSKWRYLCDIIDMKDILNKVLEHIHWLERNFHFGHTIIGRAFIWDLAPSGSNLWLRIHGDAYKVPNNGTTTLEDLKATSIFGDAAKMYPC